MIEVIALVAELAPKVIGAGKSVADVWRSAGDVIADAEKTEKVDADAAMRMTALVYAALVEQDPSQLQFFAGWINLV